MLHVSTKQTSSEMTQGKESLSHRRLGVIPFSGSLRDPSIPILQRKCDCKGTEGDCSDCATEENVSVQRSAAGHSKNAVPPIVHDVLQSSGQPLDAGTRAYMEPRFGHDFSDVRVHNDAEAASSASAVNAFAYTVENHIVLGTGHHSAQTTSTKRLLAHELAHVVQQRNGGAVQKSGISNPGDSQEQQAERAAEAVMSDGPVPSLSQAASTVQRQTGDPFTDPFGEGKKEEEKKPALDPKTERAYKACPDLCKTFPPVEVARDAFVTVCDDSVLMKGPDVRMVGCTPNRQGNIGFFAGAPAWQLPTNLSKCNLAHCVVNNAPTAGIQVGYIQTVENVLSGGVYFQKDQAGKWVWAGNQWWCAKNTRDGEETSKAPWYGDAKGNVGPKPFGDCPVVTDSPNVTKMKARQKTVQIAPGVEGGGNPLRRLRIDGKFHLWLVAQPPKGSLVFIHHWSFQAWTVAELAADDADPCNESQWYKMNMNKLITSGPGQGSASPVLTGDVANKTKTDCSTK